MYTIERFFWTDLPKGAIGFGFFSIIFSLISALVSIFQVDLAGLFWYTLIGVGSGILLIVAVKRRSDVLLLPWLGVAGFQVVISPLVLIKIIWDHMSEPGLLFGSAIFLILITLVIGYGWIGVYSLFLLLKSEKQIGASTRPHGQV